MTMKAYTRETVMTAVITMVTIIKLVMKLAVILMVARTIMITVAMTKGLTIVIGRTMTTRIMSAKMKVLWYTSI